MATHSCFSVRAEELEDRQEALLVGEGRNGSRRSIVVRELQMLFELSYKNRINPLPDLRKSYPAFAWRFVSKDDAKNKELLLGIANEGAFVWLLPNSEFVSAKPNEDLANFANCVVLSHHDDALCLSRAMLFARIQDHAVQ